jgi:transketolase N-terminal domain/subunit
MTDSMGHGTTDFYSTLEDHGMIRPEQIRPAAPAHSCASKT